MLRKAARYIAHLPGIDQARVAYRCKQQHAAFTRKLRLAASPKVADFSLPNELAILAPRRRPLSARPQVLAVGHEDWERFGLWPSFRRLSSTFDLLALPVHRGGEWTERDREGVTAQVLQRIDQAERLAPVELVYMYCDSSYVATSLLRELSHRGIWTVLMALDDQHKFLRRRRGDIIVGQCELAPLVDLYWTTWKLGADLVVAHGGRAWCAPEAADPSFHRPTPAVRDLDVVLVGANYGVRARLVRFLRKEGISVSTFGSGWPEGFLSFEETVDVFSRAKVVLGVGNVGEMSGVFHMKGRDFEAPMCGVVYLTSYNPDLADAFEIGREILCYSSFQNCAEVLRWILAHPAEQESIRSRALARSLRDHTWEQRLSGLFRLIRSNGPDGSSKPSAEGDGRSLGSAGREFVFD